MYKCKELDTVHFPGGTLKLAEHMPPPTHKELNRHVVGRATGKGRHFQHRKYYYLPSRALLAVVLAQEKLDAQASRGSYWML